MNLAIIGATGNVGRKTIEILENSKIKIDKLFLVASKKSAGKKIKFKNQNLSVIPLEKFDFSKAKISFFAAGSQIAKKWVKKASKKTIVIDNSKFFRMKKEIPLVVPEVNPETLKIHKNIISNPNCSTIQMVMVLKPLHKIYGIKRVIVSTYQAVSGAGKSSMDELLNQTKKFFTKQIAFNVIPHIDKFVTDGYTNEEMKMELETKKILDQKVSVSATCVRVPVLNSHSESVNIEFKKKYNLKKIRKILNNAKGCRVLDSRKNGGYVTPVEADGKFQTFISRIRKDRTKKNAVNLWIVSDNLLKGAALNSIQIAEKLIKQKNL